MTQMQKRTIDPATAIEQLLLQTAANGYRLTEIQTRLLRGWWHKLEAKQKQRVDRLTLQGRHLFRRDVIEVEKIDKASNRSAKS